MRVLLAKFYDTVKCCWDFRFLFINSICLGIGFLVDAEATKGVLLFCLFIPVIWVTSLVISKIIRPGIRSRELIAKAMETSTGAAIIYAVNRAVLIAIGLSFILWWARP
jgi:hypothetical protein